MTLTWQDVGAFAVFCMTIAPFVYRAIFGAGKAKETSPTHAEILTSISQLRGELSAFQSELARMDERFTTLFKNDESIRASMAALNDLFTQMILQGKWQSSKKGGS